MFSQKTEIITETTLPPNLQSDVDTWQHHSEVNDDTKQKIKNIFGDKSFITFPLQGNAHITDDIIEHIHNNGYSISDAHKGVVSKVINPGVAGREKTVFAPIESVLNKTKAPPQMISEYTKMKRNNDAVASGLHVVITHSPYGVAAMSTGTSWDKTSCMRMPGGSNCGYLKNDLKRGTHVAYLVHESDPTAFKTGEPTHPISRIAIKPFHAGGDDAWKSDTVYRPEQRTYGDQGVDLFSTHVSNWANENYPLQTATDYIKDNSIYHDTDGSIYRKIDVDSEKKKMETDSSTYNKDLIYDKPDINTLVSHAETLTGRKLKNSISYLTSISNLDTSHITRMHKMIDNMNIDELSDTQNEMAKKDLHKNLAFNHGNKFNTDHINSYIDRFGISDMDDLPNKILGSPALPNKVLDDLSPNMYDNVRASKITPKHIDKLIDAHLSNPSGTKITQNMLTKFNSKQIYRVIDNPASVENFFSNVGLMANHPEFTKETHDMAINKIAKLNKITGHAASAAQILLRKSKYASLHDAEKLRMNDRYGLESLYENEHVNDDTNKDLKDIFVSTHKNIPASDPDFRMFSKWKFNNNGTTELKIPERFAKHLTRDDMTSLANNIQNHHEISPLTLTSQGRRDYIDAYHEKYKTNPEAHIQQYMNAVFSHLHNAAGLKPNNTHINMDEVNFIRNRMNDLPDTDWMKNSVKQATRDI